MKSLYSKSALILKALYSLIITTIYPIFALVTEIGNPFMYLIVCALPIACLYTIPFLINASFLKKDSKCKLKRLIPLDTVSVAVPAIIGILICDFVTSYINKSVSSAGFVSAIFIAIFITISLVFWLVYLIINKIK